MVLNSLEEKIKNNKIDEAITLIDQLGESKSIESVPLLIKFLLETDNINLRNSIALALSDIGIDDAIEPLINLIKDPKTRGSRGTLLFALAPFDCSRYIDVFIELLLEDSFETSRQSFILLENNISRLQKEEKQQYRQKIISIITSLEDKMELLSESLELLEP